MKNITVKIKKIVLDVGEDQVLEKEIDVNNFELLTFDCDETSLDDEIVEYVTQTTGFLVLELAYEIIS